MIRSSLTLTHSTRSTIVINIKLYWNHVAKLYYSKPKQTPVAKQYVDEVCSEQNKTGIYLQEDDTFSIIYTNPNQQEEEYKIVGTCINALCNQQKEIHTSQKYKCMKLGKSLCINN